MLKLLLLFSTYMCYCVWSFSEVNPHLSVACFLSGRVLCVSSSLIGCPLYCEAILFNAPYVN